MPATDDSRAAAARWFARSRDPAMSPQERKALAAWLAASAQHRAEYAALERIWQAAGAMDPARLRALAAPSGAAEADVPLPARAHGRWRGALAAGLGALAVGAGWALWQHGAPGSVATLAGTQAQAMPAYEAGLDTAPGERRSVSLPDGTRIQLNTRTRLAVRFHEGRRTVQLLEGEAMFEVAHDAARPFTVDAGAGRITVTGTRFDVRREVAGVAVAVESGSVSVQGQAGQGGQMGQMGQMDDIEAAAARRATRLSAGLGTRIRADGEVAPAVPVDLSTALAWRDGKLVFRDEPLSAVVAEVSRYRRQPVRVADAATGRLRVSSVFNADDTDALLAALPQFLPVGVRRLADGSTEIFSR